jgi:glycosyltransferase involved in cell wall biosynthesis
MKILIINPVFNIGSTGRSTKELTDFFQHNGHEAYVAYAFGRCDYYNSFKYGRFLSSKISAIKARFLGTQGYASKNQTNRLISYIKKINPDIIKLNNVHGNQIDIGVFFNWLSQESYPVIWTFHDCWNYTAVCFHYTEIKCDKWKTGCDNGCPVYKPWVQRRAKNVEYYYNRKKRMFNKPGRVVIVPVSDWLLSEVQQSFLKGFKTKRIYNWVDTAVFKPLKPTENAQDSKQVLLVSAVWQKGTSKYDDLFSLADDLSSEYDILVVGKLGFGSKLPKRCLHIGFTKNTHELAELYSKSLVYVHLSVEDTFGKVVAEALACGTPAIVYDSTALPEIIDEDCGFVVPPRDVEGVIQAIIKIDGIGKQTYQNHARNRALRLFNAEANMNEYLKIATSLKSQ